MGDLNLKKRKNTSGGDRTHANKVDWPQMLSYITQRGGVAQMVERTLSMREAQGSIPCSSTFLFLFFVFFFVAKKIDSDEI